MNERSIFMEALAKQGAERSAYLAEACGGDAALLQRVEALLQSHEQAGNFLAKPVAERLAEQRAMPAGGEATSGSLPTAESDSSARPGTVIGPYKLLQQIGEGGMGTVFMAEQTEPVQRKVALKLIKSGLDSRQVIARFEAERQALALMDHPNIAKVLDAGTVPFQIADCRLQIEKPVSSSNLQSAIGNLQSPGRPYFVMELVKGVPITKYCDEHHLTPRERLELFVPVCQAVQHAHQKGIIHRDIKPSNVMVCLYDGRPVPKVIDFGVAKAAGPKLTERTLFTELGQVVGTLEYMSPEQAELNQLDVDTRSDIYSLGVLLYELLTGTTPLERGRLKQAAFLEVLRLIREEEPPRPSTRLSTTEQLPSIAANRGLEPKKLSGMVRGELDWIVMKALEKDRSRRYETANGLAADVLRYLADEAVQACPPSLAYRFRKFVRRNRGPVLAGTLLILALIGGVFGTTIGLIRAVQARAGEETQRIEAETQAELARKNERAANEREAETRAVLDFVENKVFAAARPKDQEGGRGFDVKLADAVRAALPFVNKSFTTQPLIEARLRMSMGLSFMYLGDNKTAIEQYQAARQLYTQHRGPDHLDTLKSIGNVALASSAAGRFQEALKLREETLELMKAKLGPDHPDTLSSMHNLAISYAEAGRTAEALRLKEETLRLRKDKLSVDDPDTLSSMNSVALAYIAGGRPQEALELLEETLRRRKAVLGPDHPETLATMNNLGLAHATLGRDQEALELFEETLRRRKGVIGLDHPDTLTTMANLANSYAKTGRMQESLKLREESLELMKGKLGSDHPNTLTSMNNLANFYISADQAAKAIAVLQETLTLRERRVAADPGNSLERSYLALTYGQMGEGEQARLDLVAAAPFYARSVAMFEKLDEAGALKHPVFRRLVGPYRQRLALCRKAEQAVKDLDFALKQPAAEVPQLLDQRVRFLLKERKLEAAVESSAKMKDLAGDSANQLYDAACAYALCAGFGATMKPQGADTTALARQYADQALALLKQAVARGYKDAAR
jgi:serine/threonine protein kinase/tetratricopeptide (TPR) repeat protein